MHKKFRKIVLFLLSNKAFKLHLLFLVALLLLILDLVIMNHFVLLRFFVIVVIVLLQALVLVSVFSSLLLLMLLLVLLVVHGVENERLGEEHKRYCNDCNNEQSQLYCVLVALLSVQDVISGLSALESEVDEDVEDAGGF